MRLKKRNRNYFRYLRSVGLEFTEAHTSMRYWSGNSIVRNLNHLYRFDYENHDQYGCEIYSAVRKEKKRRNPLNKQRMYSRKENNILKLALGKRLDFFRAIKLMPVSGDPRINVRVLDAVHVLNDHRIENGLEPFALDSMRFIKGLRKLAHRRGDLVSLGELDGMRRSS
jgi:hypothetical protein